MTRTAAREIAIQLIYGLSSNQVCPGDFIDEFFEAGHYSTLSGEDRLYESEPGEAELGYIKRLVTGVMENRPELDGYIEKYAKNWRVSRISRTAAAIMRAAMYEVLYMDDVPDASAIDEAVELAKGYEEQETVAFINGILGGFIRAEKPEAALPDEEAHGLDVEEDIGQRD